MADSRGTASLLLQGVTATALVVLAAIALLSGPLLTYPEYEYRVVSVSASHYERIGPDAMKPSLIEVDQAELSRIGGFGWELVSCFLESETAYPNFGDDKYVTGLQTNIRPQRLVLIFRRRTS